MGYLKTYQRSISDISNAATTTKLYIYCITLKFQTPFENRNYELFLHVKYSSIGILNILNCVKSVRIRSFSDSHFPAVGLNTEIFSLSFRIQSECGKIRNRKTPNTDIFHAVLLLLMIICCKLHKFIVFRSLKQKYKSMCNQKEFLQNEIQVSNLYAEFRIFITSLLNTLKDCFFSHYMSQPVIGGIGW